MVRTDVRKSIEEVAELSSQFTENPVITEAMDLTGVMILVINDTRQIVYANQLMLKAFQVESLNQVLGQRPGEAIRCVHAHDSPGGCGTGPACANCSAVNLILRGMASGIPEEDEVAIMRGSSGVVSAVNMKIRVVPYDLAKETYYLLSLQDNTDRIRRRELERTFFHDILNATGAIKNYLSLVLEDAPESLQTDVSFLDTALAETIEDIKVQRSLGDAEDGDYPVELHPVSPEAIGASVMAYFRFHKERECAQISLNVPSNASLILTDPRLLRRILINMVKNALEASNPADSIVLGYERLSDSPYAGRFSVSNPGVMPEAVKERIFMRSFTTKGRGRGLGTYSMKLFGETYLRGKVGFTSNLETGTEFYIMIPSSEEGKP